MVEELDLDAIEARYRIRIKYRRDIYANLDYEPDVSAEEEVLALVAECQMLRGRESTLVDLLRRARYELQGLWNDGNNTMVHLDRQFRQIDVTCRSLGIELGIDDRLIMPDREEADSG